MVPGARIWIRPDPKFDWAMLGWPGWARLGKPGRLVSGWARFGWAGPSQAAPVWLDVICQGRKRRIGNLLWSRLGNLFPTLDSEIFLRPTQK